MCWNRLGILIGVARQGDLFEPGTGWITPSPATRSVSERAHLEAVLLADAEVTSEHILLALASYWTEETDALERPQRGSLDPAVVRRRVLDCTEGRALPSRQAAVEPPWMRPDPEAAKKWPQGLELAPTPEGKDPRRRRPWGSRSFVDSDGKPILWANNGEPRQYFVDRDGHPVLTSDRQPVHLAHNEQGHEVLNEDGRPVVAAMEVPEGSAVRPAV